MRLCSRLLRKIPIHVPWKTSRALSMLPTSVKFPYLFQTPDGTNVVLEEIKEDEIVQVHKLFTKAAESGDGLGVDEMTDETKFREYCKRSRLALTVRDVSTRALLAFTNITDSPLCRSNKPIMHAGYVISDPHYRQKKVGAGVMRLWSLFAILSGYRGVLGRTGLLSVGALTANKRNGALFIGVIPTSIHMLRKGWVDDQISYVWYQDFVGADGNQLMTFEDHDDGRTQDIPPLSVTKNPIPLATECTAPWNSLGDVLQSLKSDRVTLHVVQSCDLMHKAQCLIRDLAMQGQGFGVDEFDPTTGFFNHRLLKEGHFIAVKSENSIVGFLCIGRSALCRSDMSKTVSGYIALYPQFQNRQIGTNVMVLMEQIARHLGFEHIIYDVLSSNVQALAQSRKQGYILTGSLPYCCVVRNVGYETSLVWYKRLSRPVLTANL